MKNGERDPATGSSASRSQRATTAPRSVTVLAKKRPKPRSRGSCAVDPVARRCSMSAATRRPVPPVSAVKAQRSPSNSVSSSRGELGGPFRGRRGVVQAGRRGLFQGQQGPGVADVVVPGQHLALVPVVAVEEPSVARLVLRDPVDPRLGRGPGLRRRTPSGTPPGARPPTTTASPPTHASSPAPTRPRTVVPTTPNASEPSYARPVVTNRGRWVVTVVVSLVVVAPALLPDPERRLPDLDLSDVHRRAGRVVDLDTAVLVDEDGRHRLSPAEVGGTDEIVAAAVAVSAGPSPEVRRPWPACAPTSPGGWTSRARSRSSPSATTPWPSCRTGHRPRPSPSTNAARRGEPDRPGPTTRRLPDPHRRLRPRLPGPPLPVLPRPDRPRPGPVGPTRRARAVRRSARVRPRGGRARARGGQRRGVHDGLAVPLDGTGLRREPPRRPQLPQRLGPPVPQRQPRCRSTCSSSGWPRRPTPGASTPATGSSRRGRPLRVPAPAGRGHHRPHLRRDRRGQAPLRRG